MKLYHAPGSCSQAICIVLQETGLNTEIIKVNARKHLLDDRTSYYDLAELGYVPLLQLDDGTFLREGPVIAQYLADQRPESGLAPAHGTRERYQMLEWLNFLTSEVHKGCKHLTTTVVDDGEKRHQSGAHHFRFDGHHCDRVGSQAG
ncbi:glutathione S-transferase [Paraburkholderia sp. 35.1]